MKSATIAIPFIACLLAAPARTAIATTYELSVLDCRWPARTLNAPFSAVGYSEAGVGNLSTSLPLTLACPAIEATTAGSFALTAFLVNYRDNNGLVGGDVRCHGVGVDSAGNLTIGADRYSCSTYGGCPAPPTTGFTSPTGTFSGLLVMTAATGSTSYSLECSIPKKISGASYSYLISYPITY